MAIMDPPVLLEEMHLRPGLGFNPGLEFVCDVVILKIFPSPECCAQYMNL